VTRSYVSAALRQAVIERAAGRCEYCLYAQEASFLVFEVEHIVAEKHGGETTLDNLALSCPYCNRFKGTDLGSLDPQSGQLVPFFNPRTQQWNEHFRLENARIVPLTPAGRVAVAILRLNHLDRLLERQHLKKAFLNSRGYMRDDQKRGYEVVREAFETSRSRVWTLNDAYVDGSMNQVVEKLLNGQITAQDAGRLIAENGRQALEELSRRFP